MKTLLDSAKRDRIKDILSIELRRLETKLADLIEKEKKVEHSAPVAPSTEANTPRTYDVAIKNYSWDQSDAFVKIYLTGLAGAKELPNESFELKLEKNGIFFKISNFNGKNMIFSIKELSEGINSEKSYYKAKSDMVVLFLKKTNTGDNWKHLKRADKDAAEKPKFAPKAEDNADPSAGLMSMMKQMYEEGDDDMKRTIAKAWTESNSKRSEELGKLDL